MEFSSINSYFYYKIDTPAGMSIRTAIATGRLKAPGPCVPAEMPYF